MREIVYLVSAFILISACKGSTDFKEIRDLKNSEWTIAKKEVFEFEIKDTVSTYKVNYLIRNAVSYPYYNLYLSYSLLEPTQKQMSNAMDEVILFNQKTGKPYGDGLGDIFDNRVAAPKLQAVKFSKVGKYKIKIGHNMRPDPLTGIMSIGVEVIKNVEE